MKGIILDFETEGIEPRHSGNYPPVPVGVAIDDGNKKTYTAWGLNGDGKHGGEEAARRKVAEVWDQPLVFHNAKFDIEVAMKHWELPWPKQFHDTMVMRFLTDPHANSLSLKPSAESVLGIKPEEQDNLRAWILANVPEATVKNWGAFICRAPSKITRPYAIGDVFRTRALAEHLIPAMLDKGLMVPYKRELTLMPILLEAEQKGVRVDVPRLAQDMAYYQAVLARCDDVIRKLLDAPKLSLDSNNELADAIEKAGLVDNGDWKKTPKGKRSVSKKNLMAVLGGTDINNLISYRNSLQTCIGMFGLPWLEMASAKNRYRVYPNWHQTRDAQGGGARTGRMSCTDPNLQNPSKEFEIVVPDGFPDLPLMRQYLLPEEGEVWVRTDASQQELRLLAHFAEGQMLDAYREDPTIDFHEMARLLIKRNTGISLTRKHTKTTAFSILYGAGARIMAERLGCSVPEAESVRAAYYQAIPSIRTLQRTIKDLVAENAPIRTWGGRIYYVEEPLKDPDTGVVIQRFDYKLLNYLIQGSAADCTKQAVINYNAIARYGKFVTQVHDEINISVPKECMKAEAQLVRDAFADIELDVPMLSDSMWGINYSDLEAV